jgi:hypothetical protein
MQSHLSEDFRDIFYCPSKEDQTTIIPDHYDFRIAHKECAGEVMNQGYCSSGYAIVAASVLSDRLCLVNRKRVSISPQFVISCDNITNENCTRGFVHQAWNYYKDKNVLVDDCLPYTASKSLKCNPKCSKVVDNSDKFAAVCGLNNAQSIKREILENGPVAAMIQAYDDFLTYKSGVYDSSYYTYVYAGSHTVKVIGWGEENNVKYWIVENSWGTDWGENGYARLLLDDEDDIGISRIILAPVVQGEKGDKNKEAESENA